MQQNQFREIVKNAFKKRYALFDKKSHDYATQDCLSNFKRMSALVRLLKIDLNTPEGVALFDVVMKIDRLANLLNKKEKPSNESLDDTLSDAQNYIDLLRGLLYERESKNGNI